MQHAAPAGTASMAALRLQANELFKAGKLVDAAALYEQSAALRTDKSVAEASADVRDDEAVKCFGNLCTVYSKLGRSSDVLRCAVAATEIQPTYPKGLAFRGQEALAEAVATLRQELTILQEAVLAQGGDAAGAASVGTCLGNADQALTATLEAYRWVGAASLLAPTFAEQLRSSHVTYAEATAEYAAVMTAVSQHPAAAGVLSATSVETGSSSRTVTAGTGVLATSRLPMHHVVCELKDPICVGYYADNLGARLCVNCAATDDDALSGTSRYISCTGCSSVAYCSERCAAVYAERHGKFECQHMTNLRTLLKRIEAEDRDAPAELAEAAMHTITAISALKVGHPGANLLEGLDHHADEVTHTLGAVVPLVCDLLGTEDRRLVQTMCGATRCNAIQVADASGLGVGQAVFGGIASRFNHSCVPNAAIDSEKRVVRAIRPIRPGEEITVSYTPQLYLPREQRRRVLSDRYFFTCRCAACSESAKSEPSPARTVELLLRGTFPGARSDVEDYYRGTALGLADAVRGRDADEIDASTLNELLDVAADVRKHCMPTHFLAQELRNATVFVASVLGRKDLVETLAEEEAWLWELVVPGALPVKYDKLRNWLIATEGVEPKNAFAADNRAVKATAAQFYGIGTA
jgi:hypothetical protein